MGVESADGTSHVEVGFCEYPARVRQRTKQQKCIQPEEFHAGIVPLERPEPNPDGRIRDVEEAMSVAASVLECRPED